MFYRRYKRQQKFQYKINKETLNITQWYTQGATLHRSYYNSLFARRKKPERQSERRTDVWLGFWRKRRAAGLWSLVMRTSLRCRRKFSPAGKPHSSKRRCGSVVSADSSWAFGWEFDSLCRSNVCIPWYTVVWEGGGEYIPLVGATFDGSFCLSCLAFPVLFWSPVAPSSCTSSSFPRVGHLCLACFPSQMRLGLASTFHFDSVLLRIGGGF